MYNQPIEEEKWSNSNSNEYQQELIRLLVGTNSNFTTNWFDSVCGIINDFKLARLADKKMKTEMPERMESTVQTDSEKAAYALNIQGDLSSLAAELQQLSMQKRRALNDFLDLKGNIRVFCRVRPFLPDESCNSVINSDSSSLFLKMSNNKSKTYSFDKIFHRESTQEEVFSEIKPLIKSALDGYNVCILGYGQTGTGKTYTMEGTPNNPGIVLRGIKTLFEQASDINCTFQFTFSMLEIYMGNLRDLLVRVNSRQRVQKAPSLSIKMKSDGTVDVDKLDAIEVKTFQQVERLYKIGTQSRLTASTKSNSTSSRSHCLICISMTSYRAPTRQRETNKIWMVDLGGSERLLKTQATGRRLQEGKAINLSLSALGDVISALHQNKMHVPFRNSKLTQVLRDSLGSDAKTLMIVHVSPKEEDLCETICSLGFATRVRSIHLENDAPDMRAKKEVEVAKLEQKVKELETEHLKVRKDIEKLHERLRCLINLQSLSHECLGVPLLPSEESNLSAEPKLLISEDIRAKPSLPKFMKPTISSGQKSTSVHHSYRRTKNKKPPIVPRNRRPASEYAESVTPEAKTTAWHSEDGSNCSISTTSFATQRQSADDGTGFSQLSEYETKEVIFPEEGNSPKSSITSLSHESTNTSGNTPAKEPYLLSESVEDWLYLQFNKLSTNSCRRALAFPTSKRSNNCIQENSGAKGNRGEVLGVSDLRIVERKQVYDINNHGADTVDATKVSDIHTSHLLDTKSYMKSSDSIANGVRASPGYQAEIIEKSFSSSQLPMILPETFQDTETSTAMEDYNEDSAASPTDKKTEESSLYSKRLKATLFMTKDLPKINQKKDVKDPNTSFANIKNEEQGKARTLMKRFQILCASVGLVLGFQNIGLGSDFFHALML